MSRHQSSELFVEVSGSGLYVVLGVNIRGAYRKEGYFPTCPL